MERADFDAAVAYFRDEIRHESGLLLGRLNALFSCQAFLMIAYATSLGSASSNWQQIFTIVLPPFLALLGAGLAFEARHGIAAARTVIGAWQQQLDELLTHQAEQPHAYRPDGVASLATLRRKGELFSVRTPWIFIASWTFLGLLPVWLYHFG